MCLSGVFIFQGIELKGLCLYVLQTNMKALSI